MLARGHVLRTHCDTELLPHLYEEEGIGFAARLNGIFAFALFDRSSPEAVPGSRPDRGEAAGLRHDATDAWRSGRRPRPILASGLVGAELDEASLHLTMNVRYVPGERTFFRGIRRLAPGHVLEFADGRARVVPRTRRSTGTPDDDASLRPTGSTGSGHHYQAAVKRQLLSDVPVGVSLSGGIDSSSIVAMLRQQRDPGTIKTFSLGFDEPTDELDDARFVAETFGTDHHEIVLHEPALKPPARGHPPHGGAEGQLAPALPAAPLHRRAREGRAVRAGGRRAVRRATTSTATWSGTERLRHRAVPAAAIRAASPALDWAGRPSVRRSGRPQLDLVRPAGWSGWRRPTTRPATTCCSATPGTSTRRSSAGSTRPTSSTGSQTATRDEFDGLLRRRRIVPRPRRCGPSSPRRWSPTCSTTRTRCRWPTPSSPGCRSSTSSWSASRPGSPTTSAFGAG